MVRKLSHPAGTVPRYERTLSSVRHLYILADRSDFRVPVTQSFKLFRALEDNGVETKFIAYPGRQHLPRDPVRTIDVYRRWVDWVARHFAEAQPARAAESTPGR
jgi:hypothetical protein